MVDMARTQRSVWCVVDMAGVDVACNRCGVVDGVWL